MKILFKKLCQSFILHCILILCVGHYYLVNSTGKSVSFDPDIKVEVKKAKEQARFDSIKGNF